MEHNTKNLPNNPGVYIMRDKNGKIIYVGKSKKLKNRVTQYFRTSHSKIKDWDVIIPLDLLKQREATQNIFTIVLSFSAKP